MHQQDYTPWPAWQRTAFRFVFSYFSLYVLSYPLFHGKPGLGFLHNLQNSITGCLVVPFNNLVLHVPGVVTNPGYMTDTPYRFVQIVLFLFLAALVTVVWGFLGRTQKSHNILSWYFSKGLRYFLSYISFLYGTYKLFGVQMPRPTLAQLHSPFGNLEPMELAWLHIGYSMPYQFFLGLVEVLVGVLLLYRRTTMLAALIALGVYIEVMAMNFCYDISVKMFSTHLVLLCMYLLLPDGKNLASFFIFNRPVPVVNRAPAVPMPLWVTRVFKWGFGTVIALMFADRFIRMTPQDTAVKPISPGVYEVHTFVKNNDTLPVLAHDSLMWKDFIFEPTGNRVTVNSADTLFQKTGAGGIFRYKADTLNKRLLCYKTDKAKVQPLFTLQYNMPHKDVVEFRTVIAGDSLYLKLIKNSHKYTLGQNQFHFLRNYNE
jgi:hypothetical protein